MQDWIAKFFTAATLLCAGCYSSFGVDEAGDRITPDAAVAGRPAEPPAPRCEGFEDFEDIEAGWEALEPPLHFSSGLRIVSRHSFDIGPTDGGIFYGNCNMGFPRCRRDVPSGSGYILGEYPQGPEEAAVGRHIEFRAPCPTPSVSLYVWRTRPDSVVTARDETGAVIARHEASTMPERFDEALVELSAPDGGLIHTVRVEPRIRGMTLIDAFRWE